MSPLDLAVWHLTGALRNAALHRRAFCHAKRYPLRGRWVDGTKWPDLEGCAKCQRTLRRVSYAWSFALAVAAECPACKHPRERHYGRWCRVPTGAVNDAGQALICCCMAVERLSSARQGRPDDGQGLPSDSPELV